MEKNIDEDIDNIKFLIRDLKAMSYNETFIKSTENVLSELKRAKENERIAVDNLVVLSEAVVMLTEPLGLEEDALIEEMYEKIRALNRELETYKKIAEKLADDLRIHYIQYEPCETETMKIKECAKYENCIDCIIDWARKEVEK